MDGEWPMDGGNLVCYTLILPCQYCRLSSLSSRPMNVECVCLGVYKVQPMKRTNDKNIAHFMFIANVDFNRFSHSAITRMPLEMNEPNSLRWMLSRNKYLH